jgi:hypothetical protein
MSSTISPPPPLTTPNLPIDNLEDFLEEVRKLFDNIAYHWDQILIPAEFREPLVEAWDELRPAIVTLKDEINSPDHETKLKEAGLSGKQLQLKLGILNRAWEKFKDTGTAKLLRKLLDWINKILESLGAALPGGEAVKELKDAIEELMGSD